jgi:hypothetical protein
MPKHFVADFCKFDDDKESTYELTSYRFAFLGDAAEIQRIEEFLAQETGEPFDDVEERFGTLDQGFSGDEMAGFSTSEVQPQHYAEVIDIFRKFFTERLQAAIGPNEITVTQESDS